MANSILQELAPLEIKSEDIKGLENEDSMGRGSYGIVYAITVRDKPGIAKCLHRIFVDAEVHRSNEQYVRDRFLNECLLLSKLDHPIVVKFIGVHFNPQNRSDVTLIMERLHMDLDNFLEQYPDIDTFTKVSILHDVSLGLLYLHTQLAKPIIHRDLTARNILLAQDFNWRAKIADLGVSKLVHNYEKRSATHTACPGNFHYMPPEALPDERFAEYDTPLDIFSFGHLALYIALQRFPDVSRVILLSREESKGNACESRDIAILQRKKWLDNLPEDHCLRDLILFCLKDDPRERPSTESLNMKMKVLCRLEFKKFEIKDTTGIIVGETYGSYTAVYEVTARGEPRIAKRMNDILNSPLITDVSNSERQCIWKQYYDECMALSKLDHPNILKFIGVHFNPEDRFDMAVVFERLHMSLEEYINLNEVSENTKLSILFDVSCGLLYLHTQLETPFVHGELTAANVLLTEDLKQAKIANLGAFGLIDNYVNKAVMHKKCSITLAYMPPLNDNNGTSLDVFSFGHLALYVALQQFPQVASELSSEQRQSSVYQLGGSEILKRKKWFDMLSEDHCLRNLILSCLRDDPNERLKTETVNVMMKELSGFELLKEFNIEVVMTVEDNEMYDKLYTAVHKVISRGANDKTAAAPQIAMRLSDILDSQSQLDLSSSERQRIRERFNNECMALSKLDHPNILKFIGVHYNPEDRSDVTVIFEHLHMSLEEVLNPQEYQDIHLNTKLSILYDVSCGLLYLHTQLEMPFVHGELTAANVLLSEDLQQDKIANLGILKLLQNRVSVQHTGGYSSRALTYLPSEAFSESSGRLKYDTPVDVFSFGHLALYVALQQFPETSHEGTLTVTRKKNEIETLKRKKWIDELPQNSHLRNLILQCLKDKPEERPTAAKVNNIIMNTLISIINPEKVTKINKALQKQFSELCRICRNGELNLLKEYLYYNKEVLDYSTPKGSTVLHEAVNGDQPDMVQLLLLHGFNPDVCARGGLTPLHYAVNKGQIDCVRALIENGADITVKDDRGQDAISKAERNRQDTILKLLRSKEIMMLAEKGDVQKLELRLKQRPKSDSKVRDVEEVRDMEEAMLMAVRKGNDECIPHLIWAGARGIDCALCLAIQFESIKAIAILLLCRAAINGDSAAIRSLVSEPPESGNILWYVPRVQEILSQGIINMSYPIALSILKEKYDATKELLLKVNVSMSHKQVDWSNLKLTIFDSSWMYSIAPWVLSLKLVNNQLTELPSKVFTGTQLKRLDLSQNLLKSVSMDIFSLPNLEYLSLGHNRLKELPETSNWSASLLHLDLSENLLSTLPQGIQYSGIKTLNLSRNRFRVVPKCLCRIRTLSSLDLSSMPITSVPKQIENLQNLVNLDISNTNITNLQIIREGVLHGEIKVRIPDNSNNDKPCNHIKLVILCHSDSVKEIVLSELKPNSNPSHLQFNQPLPEIDTFQWSRNFKSTLSKKDKLYFNTWMLGSPYSCCSIYPCFFTPEALYVIEWNLTNTVDLKMQIRAHLDPLIRYMSSANIFVIVVLPDKPKDLGTKSIDARLSTFFSQSCYESLSYLGYLMVVANPKVKDGQGDLQQQLCDAAQKMVIKGEHFVGHQIPESHFSLISILEERQQTLGSEPEEVVLRESSFCKVFDKIHSSDPPDKKELESMVDFLKKVGFLLHYTNVPNSKLNQYYFVSPVWLYSTLLRVVCQVLEHHSSPFVTYSELCSLINIKDEDIGQALIQLMVHYAIVLPTSRHQYLITCLLPHSQSPSEAIYCGLLRRQFTPNLCCLPVDLWNRLLSCIISNLPEIIDVSELKRESIENDFDENEDATCNQQAVGITGNTQRLTSPEELLSRSLNLQARLQDQHSSITEGSTSTLQRHASAPMEERNSSRHSHHVEPATIHEMGIQIWDSGIIYNHKGIKFSIFRCVSEVSTVEERGIEICCAQYNYGYAIMARLCWLVQSYLEENFPNLFSTKTLPQERKLTQNAVCPTCLKKGKKEPSCFSVDKCIHDIRFKQEYNCSRHPETVLLRDLIPDYLMLDFPSHLCLSKTMFDCSETRLFQTNERTSLHNGHFKGKEIVVKKYHQEDIYKRTITLPLSYVRRESAMLSSLDHPNIIKIFGFCLDPACILVEKAPLGNLHQILMNYNTAEKVSKIAQFHISCQVASALSYLHRHSIVYRVLKANSILVWSLEFNFDASIKLANFKLAAYQTQSGLMGKTTFCSYPPPEILKHSYREEKEDIIAFGILLYDLVTRYRQPHSRKPRLSDAVTTNNRTMAKLMEECLQEEAMARPSAIDLLL